MIGIPFYEYKNALRKSLFFFHTQASFEKNKG